MKRVVIPELLDDDLGTPDEIQNSLRDLRDINRNFGGFRSMAAMLRSVAHKSTTSPLTFLDVAGGNGALAKHVSRALSGDGFIIQATVLDRAIAHMSRHSLGLHRVVGDALALPFANDSFDVVACNLFCHHLESQEMMSFFNEALRVARTCVIASDLRRNLFHWIAAYAGHLVYRSRLTRHDAPASVRRAYTVAEIRAIARGTAAARLEIRRYYFQRFGLTLWKTA